MTRAVGGIRKHLELTRDLASDSTATMANISCPRAFHSKVGAAHHVVIGSGRKMSKSDDDPAGCVRLLDDAESIQRKFKRAVTDSGTEIRFNAARPAITNLLTIFHLLTGQSPDQIEEHFADKGYAQLKQELADVTIQFLEPLQQRVQAISEEGLTAILEKGAAKARGIASVTLKAVKERMGLSGAKGLAESLAGLPART